MAAEVEDDLSPYSQPSWFPSFQFKIDPSTKLKIRKFLFKDKTKLEVGADFNSQLSSWQFRAAWEDKLIGGKIGIKGREVDYTKTWMVGFSDNEMLNARLRLKFAVDMLDGRTYARFGFRTEEVPAIYLPFHLPCLHGKRVYGVTCAACSRGRVAASRWKPKCCWTGWGTPQRGARGASSPR
jgi:hypothetical protein